MCDSGFAGMNPIAPKRPQRQSSRIPARMAAASGFPAMGRRMPVTPGVGTGAAAGVPCAPPRH